MSYPNRNEAVGADDEGGVRRSLNRHLGLGVILSLLLVLGIGGWAMATNIAGAVIALGSIVVASNLQEVQHPTGGIVGEIHVRNGDEVEAGDVLVRLDETATRASLSIIERSLIESRARRARLGAERDAMSEIVFADDLIAKTRNDAEMREILDGEIRLFDVRLDARFGQKTQLKRRIEQLEERIIGLTEQAKAKSKEMAHLTAEVEGARTLYEKGLMPINRLTPLERDAARVEGQQGELKAMISAARVQITETELQITQIDRNLVGEVANELREIDAKIGELKQRRIAAQDELARINIRAPQDGIVHESTVNTVGGVIKAGETFMAIVPLNDNLTVEAKAAPNDIDQLRIGQEAMLRLSALNQRTTPEIPGSLSHIAADVSTTEETNSSFYTIRVDMNVNDVAGIDPTALVPGMPVEVFLRTEDRNVMSYLTKPIHDQLMRAFREE